MEVEAEWLTRRVSEVWTAPAGVLARYSRPVRPGPSIYQFRTPHRDWVGYALDHWNWDPAARVVDAGCGRGAYFAALLDRVPEGSLLGIDLTMAVLSSTRASHPSVPVVNADVQRLPLPTASVDVILSAHSLYHVPDISTAVAEFRRLLRPGGALLAIYDSEIDDQPELDELFLVCGGQVPLNHLTNRFSLESAPGYLDAAFDSVKVYTERPAMVVPEVEAVVSEIDDLRAVAERHLRADTSWEEMLDRARVRVAKTIEDFGSFCINEHKAVFVCR